MYKNEKDVKFPKEETPLIVFMHENNGNIGLRIPYYKELINEVGVNILSIAYRGYSDSDDVKPTEKGLMLDAEAIN